MRRSHNFMLTKSIFTLTILGLSLTSVSNVSHANEITSLELILTQGCKGCHTINDVGGVLRPSLAGVGKRLSREQIRQKLPKSDSNQHPSLMPSSSHLTEKEIDLLIDYMTGRR